MTRSDKTKKDPLRARRKVSRTRWLRAVRRIRELSATVTELRQENVTLRRQAYEDGLTGLLNRRGFDEHLALALADVERHGDNLAVILLDVDALKHINDTRGHAAGDSALRFVADALRRAVRLGDYVARLSGDEFAVLLPRTDEDQAERIAERVRATVQQASSAAGHPITVSAGVADVHAGAIEVSAGATDLCSDVADDRRAGRAQRLLARADRAERLLARADRALYAAKRTGRDRVDTATLCASAR